MHNRITKEYHEIKEDKTGGISADFVDGSMVHWTGTLKGPEGTAYENGIFVVDIQIPDQYPFVPPKMKFNTKIWHPNISSQTGAICLDILKDEWSPALTIRTALLSLQALLSSPEADDPQDAQVANQYKNDHSAYEVTARNWTEIYAQDPEKAKEEKYDAAISQVTEMGIDEDVARRALIKHKWDVSAAINSMF